MTDADMLEKIRSRCEEDGDCWVWTGATTNQGPIMKIGGKNVGVRILSWQAARGNAFPSNRRANLKCRNRLCVNPDHVVALTMSEQMRETQKNRSIAQRYTSKVVANRTRGLKISDEAVLDVRYGGDRAADAAAKHGISLAYAHMLRRSDYRRERANPFIGLVPVGARA